MSAGKKSLQCIITSVKCLSVLPESLVDGGNQRQGIKQEMQCDRTTKLSRGHLTQWPEAESLLGQKKAILPCELLSITHGNEGPGKEEVWGHRVAECLPWVQGPTGEGELSVVSTWHYVPVPGSRLVSRDVDLVGKNEGRRGLRQTYS